MMSRHDRSLELALIVALAAIIVGPVPALADDTTTTANETTPNIILDIEQDSDHSGQIQYQMTLEVPPEVDGASLWTRSYMDADRGDGFVNERAGESGTLYTWDGSSRQANLTYTLNISANTVPGDNSYNAYYAGDKGTIVPLPAIQLSWSDESGDHERLVFSDVDGEFTERHATVTSSRPIAAGVSSMAYLGEHETHTATTASNHTVSLVVADDATLAAPPDAILASVTNASGVIGPERGPVTLFAVPDPPRNGVSYQLDAWVDGSERLNTSRNTWMHEYFHTQQYGRYEAEFEWWREASVTYFTAYTTHQQGRTTATRSDIALFTRRVNPATLSVEDTWESSTPYEQGAATLAALDTAIRNETNDSVTLSDVSHRIERSEPPVSYARFQTVLADATGQSYDTWLEQRVESKHRPDPREWRGLLAESDIATTPNGSLCAVGTYAGREVAETTLGTCPTNQTGDTPEYDGTGDVNESTCALATRVTATRVGQTIKPVASVLQAVEDHACATPVEYR